MTSAPSPPPPPCRGRPRPFGALERRLALGYLRPRRVEGFISAIAGFSFFGIMTGVAVLIVVMAVMNGFRSELKTRILGVNGHIDIRPIGADIADYDALRALIERRNGVTYAAPTIEGQAMALRGDRTYGALIRGLGGSDLQALRLLSDNLIAGDLDGFDADDGLVIGIRMARRFDLAPGDFLSLLSASGPETPFGRLPQTRRFPIRAVFDMGMSEYDSIFIFMPQRAAQQFFDLGDAVNAIDVFLADADDADAVAREIAVALRGVGAAVDVITWKRRHAGLFSALQVERNVMFLILALIILIAAFNILSGLVMLVREKNRDIAVLRAMGASQGLILRVFIMTGTMIGVAGTLIGTLTGIVFCRYIEDIRRFLSSLLGLELFSPEIYFLSRLPAVVEPADVVAAAGMGVILSFLATLYPAWRASSLHPVRILRHE